MPPETEGPSKRRPRAHGRPPRRPVLAVLGTALLLAAAAGIAYPLWWNHRSSSGGARLLHETLPKKTGTTNCEASLPPASGTHRHLAGILEVPRLSLRAPVLQGLGNAVLNVAVGHDPASPWPGESGESVVEAHDVSYFSAIDGLKPGDEVVWRDACTKMVFKVLSHEIVQPGTILEAPPSSRGLALITCYPTDALFWTPDRYVVLTSLVSSSSTSTTPRAGPSLVSLKVPAPPALVAEGLSLQDNPVSLGTMAITGSPAASFREGPDPLDVEADALEAFFGAQKAVSQGNTAWWDDLAVPGLAMPSAWDDSGTLYVTIDASKMAVRSVSLHSSSIDVVLVVRSGSLLISSVGP